MVNLGFIKDASQCPQETPRVFLRRHGTSAAPTIRAWSDKRRRGVELRWEAPGPDPEAWAEGMATAIADLGWRRWWLDTQTLSRAMGLPTAQALSAWGLAFWPRYRRVASVYVRIADEGREATTAVIASWEKSFGHVRFNETLDVDRQVADRAKELEGRPVRRTLARIFPSMFK